LHNESIARCKHNSRFAEFLPLIYPPELEVKETTDTASSASFLDLYLEFDDSDQLSTKIYDKRDDFNFKIINLYQWKKFCKSRIIDRENVINIPVCEIKDSSLMNLLIFYKLLKNSDSYEYKNKSARRGAQFVPIGSVIETMAQNLLC
jgi:hypothetical protein